MSDPRRCVHRQVPDVNAGQQTKMEVLFKDAFHFFSGKVQRVRQG